MPQIPGSSTKRCGRALAVAFGALALITSGVFWYVASPTLGPIYDALRTVETAGLWRLTNWSRAFRSVPRGQAHDFWSIYVSSIPFGLFCAVLIGTIAAVAYEKRRSRHLYALIVPKAGALTPSALRARMKALFPHLGASKELPEVEWADDTLDNPFADLADLRNPVQVRAAVQRLPLPIARVMFLALAARFDPTQPIGGLRPGAVEAGAWKSAKPSSGKPEEAARAALTSALVLLINGRAGPQSATEVEALDAQDDVLQTPGTTATMLIALIAHARHIGSLPMSSLRWVRWSLPQLAIALIDAGVDPLVTTPRLVTAAENENARI